MKSFRIRSVIYPRHNHNFDATILVEVESYVSEDMDKPLLIHKYVRQGFYSEELARDFAYNEALRLCDVMLTAGREYLKKYGDAQ